VSQLPLAERRIPRYPDKITLTSRLRLDIGAWLATVAQPLGSLLGIMRNIITALLIVVVPRRIAGDG
jgi:hypothetical protein